MTQTRTVIVTFSNWHCVNKMKSLKNKHKTKQETPPHNAAVVDLLGGWGCVCLSQVRFCQ